ncbi:MAG: biotin synthase BioB [Elusimicrobia bacterium]|nr:biotin synthase BioB [Elusimicrobiota bacterium]
MQRPEIEKLLQLPLTELISQSNQVRKKEAGAQIELCNIINAKSGQCSEDCKFCAQSACHQTEVQTYALKEKNEILAAAQQAKDMGAERFDIVTSGNTLTANEVKIIAEVIAEIRAKIGIKMCSSLGKLSKKSLALLKAAGLSRYHHNIETSPGYFPNIVSTHTFTERLSTIQAAKSAGLEVCSGGIIGLGESWADRIDMALLLKELDITSIPINILVPIKGTPLENISPLSCLDAIKTIALFRIILGNKIIKIAAGRESILKDFQAMAFMAGANGMLIGGYLTIRGREIKEDWNLVREVEKLWNT